MNVDGILFRFIDTAGIRETSEAIEKIGIERTYRKISEADIVLGMLDITHPLTELRTSIEKIVSKIDLDQQRLIFLLNKADILPAPAIVPGAASSLASEETQDVMHSPASIHIETSSLASRDLLIEEHHNKNVLIQNFIVSLIDNKIFNKHTPTIPILTISAKTQSGIQELKNLLASIQKDLMSDTGTTLVTNIRHIEALTRAQDSLTRVRSGLADGIPTDLVAQDIREALYYIGSIVGEISTNEVLGNIFRNFCIGK